MLGIISKTIQEYAEYHLEMAIHLYTLKHKPQQGQFKLSTDKGLDTDLLFSDIWVIIDK